MMMATSNSLRFQVWLSAFLAVLEFANGLQAWYPHDKLRAKFLTPKLVSFQVPITLYDELHNSFKVYPRGIIGFENKLSTKEGKINLKKEKLIAPFLLSSRRHSNFQQCTIDVVHHGEVLRRATIEIQKFFYSFRDFEAEQVIILSWSHRQRLIHQSVIITNGKHTFLQLMYKDERKLVRRKAQAGISIGDAVRYTYFSDPNLSNIAKLLKSSNVNQPGRWAFLIGSSEGSVFQTHPANTSPFVDNRSKFMFKNGLGCYTITSDLHIHTYKKNSVDECIKYCRTLGAPYAMAFRTKSCSCLLRLYKTLKKISHESCDLKKHYQVFSTSEFLDDAQGVFDVDECSSGSNVCSSDAICENTRFGFTCRCKGGYIGNGKVCIPNVVPARILGKFTGSINGKALSDADLSGIILVNTGVSYLTISTISEQIGFSFQLGASATDIIGWVFATKANLSLKNGLDIIGDRFKSKIVLEFDTGDVFTATQQMKGRDDFNYFVMDTQVNGRLPIVEPYTRVKLQEYSLELRRTENGVLEGKTIAFYTIRNKKYRYTLTMTIYYNDNEQKISAYKQMFRVDRRNAFYDSRQMLIRFQQQNSIQTLSVITKSPNPSTTISTTAKSTTKQTFGTLTKSAGEVITSSVQTTKATRRPTTAILCNGQQCDVNARCSQFGGVTQCTCIRDYIGNGTHCQIDTRLRCGPNRCSKDAECVEENNRLFCLCKGGFVGDGVTCKDEKQCNCHPDATCFSNGQGLQYCLCNTGFRGDGGSCEDINECTETSSVCGKNSHCINTRGSYICKCNQGYRKNGTYCEDVPECSEKTYVCHSTAECVELPGSYKCVCREGYRFGPDGRTCVVKCRRCLHRGICIEPNLCQCRRGYTGSICQWAGNEFLILARGGTVKRVSIPHSNIGIGSLLERPGHVFVAVDYDCQDKMVYWTDLTSGSISRVGYNGSNSEVIVQGLVDPQGITIDWLGRNIFWTDTGSDRIGVARLDGLFRKESLISGDLKNPRAIVCNPYQGKLYWTDWNRSRPRIEVSSMDGSSRKDLVKKDLALPNGLIIDYKSGKLCWTDAWYNTISCIDFDGKERVVLFSEAKYPFSLAMHGSILYWTEWETGEIGRFHRDKKIALPSIKGGIGSDGRLYDIKVVTPCPDRKNICSKDNGKCIYFCLMKTQKTRSCKCPDGNRLLFPNDAC